MARFLGVCFGRALGRESIGDSRQAPVRSTHTEGLKRLAMALSICELPSVARTRDYVKMFNQRRTTDVAWVTSITASVTHDWLLTRLHGSMLR